MSFRALIADLVLGGNLANAYSLTGTITIGDPAFGHIVLNGDTDAILIYESANTLMLSFAPAAGIDPHGTHYPAGIAVFDPNFLTPIAIWDEPDGFSLNGSSNAQSMTLTSAPLNLASGGAAYVRSAFIQALGSYLLPSMDALVLSSPTSQAALDSDLSSIAFALSQGNAVDGAIAAFQFLSHTVTALMAQIDKTGFNIAAGTITAPHPGGTIGQAETWQAPVLTANFRSDTISHPLRFRKDGLGPAGIVRLDGGVQANGAGPWPRGTVIATLPVGYRPLLGTRVYVGRSDVLPAAGTGTVKVLNTGDIQLDVALTANTQQVYFEGMTFPLD